MIDETRLLSLRPLTPSLVEILLERPAGFEFRPGQFAALWFPDRPKTKRLYSIASPPSETDRLRFVIEVFPEGVLSPTLAGLSPGASLGLAGGMGRFYYEAAASGERIFLAGWGSGVAPLLAIRGAAEAFGARAALRYVAPSPEEATREIAGDEETFLATPGARGSFPDSIVPEKDSFDRFFLAGPHAFVRRLADLLAARGAAPEKIRLEQWG